MARPSIKTPCGADHHADKRVERIAEVSGQYGGALIAARDNQTQDRLTIAVYSADPTVDVSVAKGTPVYVDGFRAPDLRALQGLLDALATQNAGPYPTTAEEGPFILVRREDWAALVALRQHMLAEG